MFFRSSLMIQRIDLLFFITLLIYSFSITLTIPVRSIIIIDSLGGTIADNSLVFFLTGILSIALTIISGKLSDIIGCNKIIAIIAMLILSTGGLLVSQTQDLFLGMLILTISFGFMAVPVAQIFAMSALQEPLEKNFKFDRVSVLRSGYIIGWILGPVFCGIFLSLNLNPHDIFLIQGGGVLLISILFALSKFKPIIIQKKLKEKEGGEHNKILVIILCTIALVMGGDIVRSANLSIIVTSKFNNSEWLLGTVYAIVPIFEIPFLFLANYIAKNKKSYYHVLVLGSIVCFFYYGLTPFANSVIFLCLLQVAYAFVPASMLGVGMSAVQSLFKSKKGMVTSMIFAAQQMAVFFGSLLISSGVFFSNLDSIFFLTSLFPLVAFLILILSRNI